MKLNKYILLELSDLIEASPELEAKLKPKMDRYEWLISHVEYPEDSSQFNLHKEEIESLHKKLTNFVKYRMFEEP